MSSDELKTKRQNHEPTAAIAERGWRYHHLGVPTDTPRPNEVYLKEFKTVSKPLKSSCHSERSEESEQETRLFATLRVTIETFYTNSILTPPNSPSDGVRVAMIIHNGAPIELIQFRKKQL